MTEKKGCFITFEGGDGAGKTTLIQTLESYLCKMGRDVIVTRAPGGTALGCSIRSLLLDKHGSPLCPRAELFLFLADRAQHVEEVIAPALARGAIVLCDRYNDSTIAYQGVARGFEPCWTRSLCDFATAHLTPNLTLYLDIDPAIGLQRAAGASAGQDRIESEGLTFHKKIRQAFHTIAKEDPLRMKVIDASRSASEVFEMALEIIHGCI
jgi:dTMP kinase